MNPLACITCGPAFEPLDNVRRITNSSTGELGAVLAEACLRAGWDVVCFRGEASTFPPPAGVDVRPFSTNGSLAAALRSLERPPALVLHAAALCDFVLESIEGADGAAKLDSRSGPIRLTLRPAEKILPRIRTWFPDSRIIGWKFELDGMREQAIARASAQILEARTDACVVNGAAYGPGFALLAPGHPPLHFPDKPALAGHLAALPGSL